MAPRTYTDEQLTAAVATAHSWRGVLRHVGLKATSSAASRSVRRHAERLGLDSSHFTGQRHWTDDDLAQAVAASRSWAQVADRLGLASSSSTTIMKGHALRLGIDASHFNRVPVEPTDLHSATVDIKHLPRAGALLAATWFTLRGHDVSWPLEPCRYDLAVHIDGGFLRVQVKTTRQRSNDTWVVRLHTGGRHRGPYDPEDIDYFFIVAGDLSCFLVPVGMVAGLSVISLSAYEKLRLDPLAPN